MRSAKYLRSSRGRICPDRSDLLSWCSAASFGSTLSCPTEEDSNAASTALSTACSFQIFRIHTHTVLRTSAGTHGCPQPFNNAQGLARPNWMTVPSRGHCILQLFSPLRTPHRASGPQLFPISHYCRAALVLKDQPHSHRPRSLRLVLGLLRLRLEDLPSAEG